MSFTSRIGNMLMPVSFYAITSELTIYILIGAGNSCLWPHITSKATEQPTAKTDLHGRALNYQLQRYFTLATYMLLEQK